MYTYGEKKSYFQVYLFNRAFTIEVRKKTDICVACFLLILIYLQGRETRSPDALD